MTRRCDQGVVHRPGNAEVRYFQQRQSLITPSDEEVGGFEIAMHHAFLVGVMDGVTDLDEQAYAHEQRELLIITKLGDGRPM